MNQAESPIQVNSYMNDETKGKSDLIRGVVAWIVLVIICGIFWLLKPNVTIHNSPMYLPITTGLPTVNKNEVRLLDHDNFDNSVLHKKVGYITITTEFNENDAESILYSVLDQAKIIAADHGANRLLVEGTRVSDWFDSGKKTFRLYALALQQ